MAGIFTPLPPSFSLSSVPFLSTLLPPLSLNSSLSPFLPSFLLQLVGYFKYLFYIIALFLSSPLCVPRFRYLFWRTFGVMLPESYLRQKPRIHSLILFLVFSMYFWAYCLSLHILSSIFSHPFMSTATYFKVSFFSFPDSHRNLSNPFLHRLKLILLKYYLDHIIPSKTLFNNSSLYLVKYSDPFFGFWYLVWYPAVAHSSQDSNHTDVLTVLQTLVFFCCSLFHVFFHLSGTLFPGLCIVVSFSFSTQMLYPWRSILGTQDPSLSIVGFLFSIYYHLQLFCLFSCIFVCLSKS